jgi:predicted acetyltransferase
MEAVAVRPSVEFERAFVAMLHDFEINDPEHATFYAPARKDFEKYVQSLADEELGLNLKENFVPCSHRWLLSPAQELVGVTRVRHRIDTPFLTENGGHIGYDVAPSSRRKGYGHRAFAVALMEARRLGLPRVLMYASEENLASRAVIERGGGILEDISFSDFWQEQLCKYWVNVPAEA